MSPGGRPAPFVTQLTAVLIMVTAVLSGSYLMRGSSASFENSTQLVSTPVFSAWIQPWEEEGMGSLLRYRTILDEISPYWYWTLPNATIVPTSNMTGDEGFIRLCRESSIEVVPMISNLHNPDTLRLIVRNSTVQREHIMDLLNITLEGGYKGLDINYESLYTEDREFYVNFIENLTETFHRYGRVVYVSVFPKTSEADDWYGPAGYDYPGLGAHADYIKIMAYNLHWSTCNTSGPVTSYRWVDAVLSYAVSVIPREKIILGVPLFGYDWPIWPNGTTRGIAKNCSYGEIMALKEERGLKRLWNPASRTPYFLYTDKSGILHALHYTDCESLLHEMDLVRKYSIHGLSIWKLGGEDPRAFEYLQFLKENSFDNLPPYLDIGEDLMGMRGVPLNMGPVRAYDVDGTLRSVWWEFGDGESSEVLEPTHTYLKGGFYTATLHVVDSSGLHYSASKRVKVAPFANFSVSGTFREGENLIFNGTSSWDPFGIISYTWYFGDGTFLFHSTPLVEHSYSRPGEYTVTLVVIDPLGFVDICNRTVTIPDLTPPVADAGEDLFVWERSWATLDGRGSSDNGRIVNYTWVIDGKIFYGPTVRYYFERPGRYTAILTVRDEAGFEDRSTLNITVRDRTPPKIHLTYPRKVRIGEIIVLDASDSSDNVGIVNYTWYLAGTGVVYGRTEVTYIPSKAGRYFFTLDITDAEGNWNSTTVFVDVYDDKPPEGAFTISPRPRSLKETYLEEWKLSQMYGVPPDLLGAVLINVTYRFETVNLRDDSGISTVTWCFGDGTMAGGEVVYHNYTTAGYHHVVLLATDLWGNSKRWEFTLLALPSYNITVVEIPPPPPDESEPAPTQNLTVPEPQNTTSAAAGERGPSAPGWIWPALSMLIIALFILEVLSLLLRSLKKRGGKDKKLIMLVVSLLFTLPSLHVGSVLLLAQADINTTRGSYPAEDGGDPSRLFQYRGMWMDGYDIVNISEVRKVVEFARDHHINCLTPLINSNYNGVYYNSSIFPKHVDVARDFDPLMALIVEAHKYGIQVHPWVHTLYNPPVVRTHPEWACVSYWGTPSRAWLNPSLPPVRSFLLNMTMELVTNYPLDGIKFDTLRYGSYYYSFDNYSLAKFQQEGGGDFSAWRREEINEVVEMLYDAIMEVRPYMWVGADVWMNYNSWRTYLFQESREWARRGKIDYLCIMDYTTNEAAFRGSVQDYIQNSYGVPIVAGPYVFIPGNTAHGRVPNETVGIQILLNETRDALSLDTMGVAFFSYKFFKRYPSYAQALLQGPLSQEALCPLKNQTHPVKTRRWEFNKEHDREGWRLTGAGHHYPSGGFWTIAQSPSPAIMSPLVNFTSKDINVLEISFRCDSTSGSVDIYWSHNWTRFSEREKVTFQIKPDRDWHLYSIHLDRSEMWTGRIRYLRLLFHFPEPSNVTIDFVRLYWMPDCIRSWAVLGPFTTGSDEGLLERDFIGGEGDLHPRVGDVTAGRVWRLFDMERDLVDLRFAYGNVSYTALYAHVYIKSPTDLTAQLRVGSSDAIKIWLNDEKVLESPMLRWASPDQNITAVSLREGMNSLTVKLAFYGNVTGFYIRFTTTQNETVPGLIYYPDLPPIPPPILSSGLSGWAPVKSVNVTWERPESPTRIVGYRWCLDGGDISFTEGQLLSFDNLSEGIHTLKVWAVDEYGFTSAPGNATIMLDWTPPLITEPVPEAYYLTSPGPIRWRWEVLREPVSGILGYYVTVTYSTPDGFYTDYAVRFRFTEEPFFVLQENIFDGLCYNITVKALSGSGLHCTVTSPFPVVSDFYAPPPPEGLRLTHIQNTTRYILDWSGSGSDPSGISLYEVWRKVGEGKWELADVTSDSEATVERPLYMNVTFRVRARDGAGHFSLFSEEISPGNLPPVAVIEFEGPGAEGTTMTFTSTDSYDPDGAIISRYWILDGVPQTGLETFTVTLTSGLHTVRLTVKDDRGETSEALLLVNISGEDGESFTKWLIDNSIIYVYPPPPPVNDTEEETTPPVLNNTTSSGEGDSGGRSTPLPWERFFIRSIIFLLISSIALSALSALLGRFKRDEEEEEFTETSEMPSSSRPPPSPPRRTFYRREVVFTGVDGSEATEGYVYIRPSVSSFERAHEEVAER
ncbi:MAG: hypothetical protein DRN35_00695 [Thermoplasmata archaeon]|nr:MAG: hypothetical protein DRN35_00695 [Thermoplasmata archaeon]